MPPERVLVVDGYNVIHRVPELEASLDGGLQNARNRLAVRVSAWAREHPGVACVIVFDGDFDRTDGRDQRLAGVRCLFSLSAHGGDDEIIRLVRELRSRGADVTVVSDDNKVGNNCRAHGAAVRPSSFLMERKARPAPPSPARREGPAEDRGLDRKTAEAIDDELKRKFGL